MHDLPVRAAHQPGLPVGGQRLLGQVALERRAGVVEVPHAPVEELVLPHGVLVGVARPDQRHLRIAADGAVDPVGVRGGDPLEQVEDRRLPVLPLDRLLRDPEVDEDEQRHDQRVAHRHEQEQQAGADRGDQHDPVQVPDSAERRRDRPERQQRRRVRDRRQADQLRVRQRGDERNRACRDRPGDGARPRAQPFDPEHQRGQEQRGDIEHVPLLDPQRLLGGERRDLEHEPEREGDGGCQERPLGAGPAARRQREDDERDERHDPERQDQLLPVVQPPVEDAADGVPGVAGDLVGAEHAEDRGAARDLHDHDEQHRRGARPRRTSGTPAAPAVRRRGTARSPSPAGSPPPARGSGTRARTSPTRKSVRRRSGRSSQTTIASAASRNAG